MLAAAVACVFPLFNPSPTALDRILPLPREFRGAWVATVANIDWPSKRTLTPAEQRKELIAIFDTAVDLKLNAIIFQVRPSADALYESTLEPWSEFLTNEQGKSPGYDPLKFAVEEAHSRGLELHCWFNPYRSLHPSQKGPVAANHINKTHPRVSKTYGTYSWMDPGEPFVQKRSLDVMIDVVKRYDIDGVHIDDYFYPYPIKDEKKQDVPFPDEDSWKAYQRGGGRLDRDDWRRKNVDDFIEKLYKTIKSNKPWVKFGISPFGIYRPGVPEGIKAGVDQYAQLYADAKKWFVEGWCDYYTPQLYWPIKQTPQSYPVLYKWWLSQNAKGRHLWPGNYTGRTNPADGNWPAQEILDQIAITRDGNPSPGNVHFSFKAFQANFNGISDALKNGPYQKTAVVPASPWLGSTPPKAPKIVTRPDGKGGLEVELSGSNARFYAIYRVVATANGAQPTDWQVSADTNYAIPLAELPNVLEIVVVPLSKSMVQGEAVVKSLR